MLLCNVRLRNDTRAETIIGTAGAAYLRPDFGADDGAAAADFEIPGVDNLDLAIWIKNNLEIDQGILEFYKEGEPTSGWIHCSYSSDNNRNQWLKARREDGKVKYLPWLG